MESATHYGKHILGGIAIGALLGYLAHETQKIQKFKSPQGGSIYCVIAKSVPEQPLNLNYGTIITFTADVPVNYTNMGRLFSRSIFDMKTALALGTTIGGVCGTVTAYQTKA